MKSISRSEVNKLSGHPVNPGYRYAVFCNYTFDPDCDGLQCVTKTLDQAEKYLQGEFDDYGSDVKGEIMEVI